MIKSDAGAYSSQIVGIADGSLSAEAKSQFPMLADAPLPEKGQWAPVYGPSGCLLLVSYETKNDKSVTDAFRLMAVKAKKYLGDSPLLHGDHLGGYRIAALIGLCLSDYEIGHFKDKTRMDTKNVEANLAVINYQAEEIAEAKVKADVLKKVMHMVNLPSCEKTPERMGTFASDSAHLYGFSCEVWDRDKLEHMGMHAINAVGKGSQHPPVLIISRYRGNPEHKGTQLALVGKGVTFDTGGISIKPSNNMHYMKCDMAAAASIIGAIEAVARLQLPINMTAVVPAAENAVDARSLLPGDVIHSYSGKTIEVLNTDAEGRLCLADALAWVSKNEKPECIIDMATLTGSAVQALGPQAAALFTANDSLQAALLQAGSQSGDKLWPMPLWEDYDSLLHSDIADLSNLPQSPVAGSIAAAKFLEVFTNEHPNWAHIDMAGPSFTDSPFAKMKSASGYGVQLLCNFIERLAKNADI